MTLKSFQYILPISMGLFLCSCSISRNEEYENFLRAEKEKIKNEQIFLEKHRQEIQREKMALLELKERLKTEAMLLYQEKEKIAKEKIQLSQQKQQSTDKKRKELNYDTNKNGCPDSKPILLANGACRSCPTAFESFSAANAEECNKCDKRYTYSNGECHAYNASNCPNGKGFWLDDGRCRDCTGNWCRHSISSQKMSDCLTACPNRASEDDGWGPSCVVKNYCSGPNQFIDSWGECRTCGVDTQYWGNCSVSPCPGQSFKAGDYHDDCRRVCNSDCCAPGEIYQRTGTTQYGADTWVCCPLARPKWDMALKACVPG